jgi:predicted nuclease of predicted toxin-antitoxin system
VIPPVKLKLDENVPFILKRLIEAKGNYSVDSVHHEGLDGTSDPELLQQCNKEARILITLDQDFFGITQSPKHPFYGIILIKSITQGKKVVSELFKKFLIVFDLEKAKGRFITIEPAGIKIR